MASEPSKLRILCLFETILYIYIVMMSHRTHKSCSHMLVSKQLTLVSLGVISQNIKNKIDSFTSTTSQINYSAPVDLISKPTQWALWIPRSTVKCKANNLFCTERNDFLFRAKLPNTIRALQCVRHLTAFWTTWFRSSSPFLVLCLQILFLFPFLLTNSRPISNYLFCSSLSFFGG